MIVHQLINSPTDLRRARTSVIVSVVPIHLGHQPLPIRFNNLGGAIICELLHKNQHPRPQRPRSPFPHLQSATPFRPMCPAEHLIVVLPAVDEQVLEMPHR